MGRQAGGEWVWFGLVSVSLIATAWGCDLGLNRFYVTRPAASFRTVAVEVIREKQVDVFVVGSSHIHKGIDPSCFPFTLVNLAEDALDYRMAAVLCEKYWDRVSCAKVVVLELDHVPVTQDTIARRDGDFGDFYEWALSGSDLPVSPYEKIKTCIAERMAITRHGRLWPTIIKPAPEIDANMGAGFHAGTGYIQHPQKAEFFLGELGKEFDERVVRSNLDALVRLVRKVRAAGVDVVGLHPPYHPDYWSHPSSALRERYAERAKGCLAAAGLLNSDSIIDLRHFLEEDQYFADWTHLSKKGAKAASTELCRLIRSRMQANE